MEIVPPEHASPLPAFLGRHRRRMLWGTALAALLALAFFAGGASQKAGFFGRVVRPILVANLSLPSRYAQGLRADPLHLAISMKFANFRKLEYHRERALGTSVLFVSSEDFVPATVSIGDKSIPARIRLKGDDVGHLTGQKWSFRIKAKGERTILGMKQLSVHHPQARNYMFEWLMHRWLKREDQLALRYRFVEVSLNGKDLGIYALEEHFEKRLLESQGRREGPIIRFSEDLMWREIADQGRPFPQASATGAGAYYASTIEGFKMNKLREDPVLWEQYLAALELLEAFRRGERSTREVFDVQKLAGFFALSDVMGAHHGVLWHTSRFYYNPITTRLEPVGFDANAGHPLTGLAALAQYRPTADDGASGAYQDYWHQLFEDEVFFSTYVAELERLSDRNVLDELLAELNPDIDEALAILWREFPHYEFSPDVLYRNQDYIRAVLRPYQAVHAYYAEAEGEQVILQVGNLQQLPIEIISLELDPGRALAPSRRTVLSGRPLDEPFQVVSVMFSGTAPLLEDLTGMNPQVRYRVLGAQETLVAPVTGHRLLFEDLRSTELMRAPPNIDRQAFAEVDEQAKVIRLKPGKWKVTADLIIPAGYQVRAGPGTWLDLVNDAVVLSYSPLSFIGSEDAPITVASSDGTGQGLVVLNARKASELRYVSFEGLTSPRRSGWVLTGAVTFYDSPVKLAKSRSLDNRSEDALNFIRSSFEMDGVLIANSMSDALDVDFCRGEVRNSRFEHCGNDCIDVSGSTVEVTNVVVRGSGDKAISAGEASTVRASQLDIGGANVGLASKDHSKLRVDDVTLSDCHYSFASFQKKSEFGPGELVVSGLRAQETSKHLVEHGSRAQVNGRNIESNVRDVSAILYPQEEEVAGRP